MENLHSVMKFKASLLVSEVSYIGLTVLLEVDGSFNVFNGKVISSMIEINKNTVSSNGGEDFFKQNTK